jgi:hypothetical protein
MNIYEHLWLFWEDFTIFINILLFNVVINGRFHDDLAIKNGDLTNKHGGIGLQL